MMDGIASDPGGGGALGPWGGNGNGGRPGGGADAGGTGCTQPGSHVDDGCGGQTNHGVEGRLRFRVFQ